MQRIPDQDQLSRGPMYFTGSFVVTMPPDQESLENEEADQAREHYAKAHHRTTLFDRMWQQSQQRRAKQRARRITHKIGDQSLANLLRNQQKRSSAGDGSHAAEQGESEYPGQDHKDVQAPADG